MIGILAPRVNASRAYLAPLQGRKGPGAGPLAQLPQVLVAEAAAPTQDDLDNAKAECRTASEKAITANKTREHGSWGSAEGATSLIVTSLR